MNFEVIERVLVNVLEDMGITQWPLNARIVLETLGVSVLDYSSLPEETRRLLLKESEDGFTVFTPGAPVVLLNGTMSTRRPNFTLAHELAHILLDDDNGITYVEAEADYGASYLLAPDPLILRFVPDMNPEDIAEAFDISYDCARVRADRARNRRSCGRPLRDYELWLLEYCTVRGVRPLGDCVA